MACYLSIDLEETEHECGGCGRTVTGMVGWSGDLDPAKLVPVCESCLASLDATLASFAVLSMNAFTLLQAQREP